MLLSSDLDSFFVDAVDALRSYLDDIVCLGGCASALYRYHDLASDIMWGYLGTKDVDMGVPLKLPLSDRLPVATLMTNIGFKEMICGNAHEAVIKYGPTKEISAVDLEFLCGRQGLSRQDKERVAYAVQNGLYAQPLNYLEMSLNNTWQVSLGRIPGLERLADLHIQVPNPAAYVVSKVLIRGEKRKPASMQKDCFYIYEVSVIFRDALCEIRREYDQLHPCVNKWKKRFAKDARTLFNSEVAEGPVSAVAVYNSVGSLKGEDFDVNEEMVFRSVNRLLDALLE